jgi:uncharacterized membrane protein YfcA
MIYASYLPIALLLTYIASIKIIKEYQYRLSIGYPFDSNDVKWNNEIFIKYPLYSFGSGVMAGLLGIGGGLIFGPLLLELGLHPLVSTATSNFLVVFTASSTSIQFILLGMMNVDYGIACTLASTVGSFIGTILIQRLIQRTKRNSYLIFTLASVLGISTIFIPAHTLMQLMEQVNDTKNIWTFNSPC